MNTAIIEQATLFDDFLPGRDSVFPSTRYQGSKNKIVKWIDYHTKEITFDSVLDAFGGTGCVGYMFKKNGKKVIYNDHLKFNYYIGKALIENSKQVLDNSDIDTLMTTRKGTKYPRFIQDTFEDIYFTNEENQWLDMVITNIRELNNSYKQAIAFFALFQACIAKRPYNLFHRKNLYIRTADVSRSFGNKKTWDTPFEIHFRKFVKEANHAVFDNGKINSAFCSDVFELETIKTDMVYIDTPYISKNGIGVNYLDFYHFLEGLVSYDRWADLINFESKHRKMKNCNDDWINKDKIHSSFERLFQKYAESILVISYREDGIPSIRELTEILKKHKKDLIIKRLDYKYVLSNNESKEILIIAR